jgi:hypothetical protein
MESQYQMLNDVTVALILIYTLLWVLIDERGRNRLNRYKKELNETLKEL